MVHDNITINKIELASELAHAEIKKHVEAHDIYEETEDGLIYCGEAQCIFDEYYDYYLSKIEEVAR